MTTKQLHKQQHSGTDFIRPQSIKHTLSPVQETALYLYNLGLNVFPQPHGKKAGLPWKQLQYTRLHPTDSLAGIQALTAGKCNLAVMCGSTSRNLFVIDCESILALNTQIGYLRERGIPLWIVKTARGGHIYLHCAEGEVASIESTTLVDTEIRGARGYVLAAGSVHPTGVIYEWLTREGDTPPMVSIKTINWLKDRQGRLIKLKLTNAKGRKFTAYSPLSRTTQDYLANGDLLGQGSRNNRLFTAACDMLGNSINTREIERQLIPIAERSGLPGYEAHATLRSAFSRERQPARPQLQPSKKHTSEVWKHALAFAETQIWDGRTGTSDKLVFLALVERAKTASNDNGIFRASTREISILARNSLTTVQKSLKRLREANYIFYAGTDKTSQASLWRFSNIVLKAGELKCSTSPATPPWISHSDLLLNSPDAMERGALGYTGLCVYRAMVEAGQAFMPAALATYMRIPVHRVNYVLKKLSSYGLIQREKRGWRALAVSNAELDERVARPTGKLGKGAARRERYALQRALYIGQIILRARLEHFRDHFLARPHELLHEPEAYTSTLKVWRCPNCGQEYFGEEIVDTCDFCGDMTTWKRISDSEESAFDDPLVQYGILELGGVLSPPGG